MLVNSFRVVFGALIGCSLCSAAFAGGFNRGSANLDGLYGDGFGLTSGVTFVAPGRTYEAGALEETLGARSASDDRFADNYVAPYASIGGNLIGGLNCVGSYAQPYGANTSFSDPVLRFRKSSENLESDELGLTCSYGFDAGVGRAYLIGGVFHETLKYDRARDFNIIPGLAAQVAGQASEIELSGEAIGYRLGFGYEIEEIALRFSTSLSWSKA